MIDRLIGTSLDEINEMIEQANSEMKRIRSSIPSGTLPTEPPRDPDKGQMWFSDGKIYLFNGTDIETYSKD